MAEDKEVLGIITEATYGCQEGQWGLTISYTCLEGASFQLVPNEKIPSFVGNKIKDIASLKGKPVILSLSADHSMLKAKCIWWPV